VKRIHLIVFAALVAGLGIVAWFDPRHPTYRSQYDPADTRERVARWYADLREWPRAPRWDFFEYDSATGLTREAPGKLEKADWSRHYVFGRFRYNLEVQARGARLHYLSWGCDEQKDGGAWTAVGEATLQPDGRYFGVWSCLDISAGISNGGGAWLELSGDKRRIFVRYYHDTLPFGESACEEGWAEELPRENFPPLEGRVLTYTASKKAGDSPFALWGRVMDEEGNPLPGAAVKRRARGAVETHSDSRGFFRLELDQIEQLTLITAGKPGYYNGLLTLDQDAAFDAIGPGGEQVALATLKLRKIEQRDYRDYSFISAKPLTATGPSRDYDPAKHMQCGNCHRQNYDEWQASRHATMAVNPLTRAAFEHDARPAALARGITSDECTPCHSPSLAATLDQFHLNGTTLLNASGVHLEGNHCDFCHKIYAVPRPDFPGMAGSIALLRPNPRDARVPGPVKRVFGPLPDVSYLFMGACYNPLFETGALCAGCHEHTLPNGLPGQGTYSEWQQTKYAKPGTDYRECQACHMPAYRSEKPPAMKMPDGSTLTPPADLTETERKHGGKEIAASGTRYRPLSEAHKHTFIGTDDVFFLRDALSMDVIAAREGNILRVSVTLTNKGAGHALPTGHGLKRLILTAIGKRGQQTILDPTSLLPPEERMDVAQQAGVIIGRRFAGPKLSDWMQGKRKGEGDWSVPYWRAEYAESDSRLWPDQPRKYEFAFHGAESAEVKLSLRRASMAWLGEVKLPLNENKAGNAPLDTLIHEAKR
jgi:hypothetical protein